MIDVPWARLDDDFHDSPAVIAILEHDDGLAALGLWILALSWANRHLTDGHLPFGAVRRFALDAEPSAERLVETGLWERVDGGYQIVNFQATSKTKDQVLAERASARQRMATRRASSPDVRANNNRTDAARSPEPGANTARTSAGVRAPRPDPSRPDPVDDARAQTAKQILADLQAIQRHAGGRTPTLAATHAALTAHPQKDAAAVASHLKTLYTEGRKASDPVTDVIALFAAALANGPPRRAEPTTSQFITNLNARSQTHDEPLNDPAPEPSGSAEGARSLTTVESRSTGAG